MTTDKLGQEPAFPVEIVQMWDGVRSRQISGGLTKREWFAGMAMMGILCSGRLTVRFIEEDCAKAAFLMADAMLREGEK